MIIPRQTKSIPFHEFNFYIVVFSTTLYYCLNILSIIIEACNIFVWLKFRNTARSCTKPHVRKYINLWNLSHFNARTGSWNKAVVWFRSMTVFFPIHWNTGLVPSGVSLTSWEESAFLALVGHPSSDGFTIKIPYGVAVLLHWPA